MFSVAVNGQADFQYLIDKGWSGQTAASLIAAVYSQA